MARKTTAVLILLLVGGPQVHADDRPHSTPSDSTGSAVDLSGEELPYLAAASPADHVLARPWYERVDVSGFGAFWLARSGADGTRPEAGFAVKEASLFVEAQVWERTWLFFEIQAVPLRGDGDRVIRTGELYVHFRDVLHRWGEGLLGIQVGRIDLPFGEEYLWQDAPDNRLVSNTAAYPWLWDEGIALYGDYGGLGWVLSLTDGTLGRSQEDDAAKALNIKLYGTPVDRLYLSASLMKNGPTTTGALLLGGSFLRPVGARDAPSSAGASPSNKVDALLYQADARLDLGAAQLEMSAGRAHIDDKADAFDRSLLWVSLQSLYKLRQQLYAALRYSEIGTYDDDEGYRLGGEFLANGGVYGYDAKRLRRLALGLGWQLDDHTRLKVEAGRDWYEVIDASPFDPGDDERDALIIELSASF